MTLTKIEGPTIGSEKKMWRKTRGMNFDKVHSQLNATIPITLTEQNESPTGPYAEMLANEIGFVVRNYAPLNVEQWKDIESTDVTNIVQRIISKFDINMSLPGVKICVTKMCITAFYNFRYRLKIHFKKFPTVNEARENKHEEVKTQAEWDFLCDRFSSEEFQIQPGNANKKLRLTYHQNAWSENLKFRPDRIVGLEDLKEQAKRIKELMANFQQHNMHVVIQGLEEQAK